MLERGTWQIGSWRGVPIRLHWTAALGALLFGGGLRFAPGAWLGFLLVVLLHELGHAYLVRRRGLYAVEVRVHGLGGECRYGGRPTPVDRAVIAWGGVLAQALLLAVAWPLLLVLPPPRSAFVAELAHALTWANLFLMALNLLPFRPLDGAEAWKLFGHARSGGGLRFSRRPGRSRTRSGRWARGRDEPSPEERARNLARQALDAARGRGGKRRKEPRR